MRFGLQVGILFLVFFLLVGCVSNSAPPVSSSSGSNSSASTNSTLTESPSIETGPGDPVTFCNTGTPSENEDCFEEAFSACHHALGVFWSTSDGFPITFEGQGLDEASGECKVRMTIPSDSPSLFAGESANCLVSKSLSSEATGSSSTPSTIFDIYGIGPSACTGSFVEHLQTPTKPDAASAEPPAPIPSPAPAPEVKEFSFHVNDSVGPVEQTAFTVKKGERVVFHITTSTNDVSFGGLWVRAPAGNKLANESEYIFSTGTVVPGETKTVEFIADQSFQFGAYWPGSNVEKGRGTVTVTET